MHNGIADRLPQELMALATCTQTQVLQQLETSSVGLSTDEVRERQVRFGANKVAHEEHAPLLMALLRQFINPLNLLLLTLATLSMLIGDRQSPIMIFFMVILSVSLAFVQERKSNRAALSLQAMVHTTAAVVRQPLAIAQEIPIQDLVPGDILHLSAGDMIPADLRLISAKDLFINESALSGESVPAQKHADPLAAAPCDIGELANICFMGTSVVSGSAAGVVALTGHRAYFGTVAAIIAGRRPPTSFDRGVSRVAWLMIRVILVMAPLVFLVNGLTKGDWLQALLFATAVAVGLTPEMLPMIVTVNLAKGALAMSHLRVIVKRLHAIQDFGAMDILCTDKTGTLTQNRVILQKHVDLLGQQSEAVLQYAYLNSCYQSGLKNLLDMAVLNHVDAQALNETARQYRKLDEVPFDFERRRMSVAVEGQGKRLLICKGAVEEVFAASRHGCAAGEAFLLDESHLAQLRKTSEELNTDGFRVIAVAIKELPPDQQTCGVPDEADLLLVGYIAFLDPPKESAGKAIKALASHGVQVKVLTGDNDIITRKICREVDLPMGRIVLGSELAAMSDTELLAAVEQAQVFAKLSPTQKATVIKALQKLGHVVGFLGDGINDGPALRIADVGISVDSAVDIAKESADIILLDKSLLVLDRGVIEGRKVFANVLKYIRMGASSNFGNVFSVIGASAWLPFLPMLPIQVLANNLLYDISQTAIPTDNVDEETLLRPRRWEIRDIERFMLVIGPISSIFDYATYLTLYFVFGAKDLPHASLFQTGWFVESILSQTLIIHVIRTHRLAFVESRASLPLAVTTALVCLFGIALPYSPLAPLLGFTPLPLLYWPIMAAMVLTYLMLTHVMKIWLHRRFALE
jgi:Mg2+-importing ATPase